MNTGFGCILQECRSKDGVKVNTTNIDPYIIILLADRPVDRRKYEVNIATISLSLKACINDYYKIKGMNQVWRNSVLSVHIQ